MEGNGIGLENVTAKLDFDLHASDVSFCKILKRTFSWGGA